MQKLCVYWLGYVNDADNCLKLTDIGPEVNIVNLAFAVTCPSSTSPPQDSLTLDFLTSKHTKDEIMSGIRFLQSRGQKVCMSINGNPHWAGHPGGWTNLDPTQFASNVKQIVVDEFGCDGVDLDNESDEIPGQNFVDVIKALRQALGPDKIISLPVYMGSGRDEFLVAVKDDISYVCTMAYWGLYSDQIALCATYAQLVSNEKVFIGVANAANPGQCTDFSIVGELARYALKGGMMLWHGNFKTANTWTVEIAKNLK